MDMMEKGTTRCIDQLGRVVLPKSMRLQLDIQTGDSLELFLDGRTIMLRKATPEDGAVGPTSIA